MAARFMQSRRTTLRLGMGFAASALAAAISCGASAHWPIARTPQPLAHLEVIDRATGTVLRLYERDGQRYVIGAPGSEYALRIRNTSGQRILAVTSVDGVNVVTGETASPSQSGYVIDPWGSVEIAGWRKSMSRTAAFYFTDHSNSYAARTGRPLDVGVIGVAVFGERVARPHMMINSGKPEHARAEAPDTAPSTEPFASAPAAPRAQADAAAPATLAQAPREAERRDASAQAHGIAKLGTGHGRSETSHVTQVAFQRATTEPVQVLSIQYDRYERLAALGVVPPMHEQYANRTPRPFPGMRFVPDPQ